MQSKRDEYIQLNTLASWKALRGNVIAIYTS